MLWSSEGDCGKSFSTIPLSRFILSVYLLASALPAIAAKEPFSIDDYFKLKYVVELALSPDGEMIAYIVERRSLEENKPVQTIYVSRATSGAEPIFIRKIQEANSLTWISGSHELAFLLSDKEGISQLFSIELKDKKMRQLTYSKEPVVKFQFTQDGRAFAWLTENRPDASSDDSLASLYERLRDGKGIVVDYENAWYQHFIDSNAPDFAARPSTTLWIRTGGANAYIVNTPGQVRRFYWSPNGTKLSIVYVGETVPKKPFFGQFTSIGYFDLTARKFRDLARARIPSEIDKLRHYYVGGEYYEGGEWLPSNDRIIVRRTKQQVAWEAHTTWTSVDISDIEVLHTDDNIWHSIELYGLGTEPAFIPINTTTIYSNTTFHSLPFLYEITPSGIEKADMLRDVSGSVSLIQFSTNFETAAFVNESLTRPPEIYVWRKGDGVEVVSQLNKGIAEKQIPKAREIFWKSEDGVTVQGWLLEPVGKKSQEKPWPLITYVHGGPSFAMTEEFASYFSKFGGVWPYPFKVYALNGMAVFVPNYRGTRSFGDKFAAPKRLDGEPVYDIVTGIEYLNDARIADSERLAISGHSHGAWLGPLIMAKTKMFRAASFAEGHQNMVVSYDLGAVYVNREVRDVKLGASLYDDPRRYIDLSPSLHFDDLDTAVLFEAGARNAAITMKGSPKAAARAGMPTEFVVYPKTGHGMQLPRLQREAAERNLDWFRFWLLDEEDSNPKKTEQYKRWHKMRDELNKRDKSERLLNSRGPFPSEAF